MANEEKSKGSNPLKHWVRIPDGIKVRCGPNGIEGAVDGLTELVIGSNLNPDGKTQYRIDVGGPTRELAAETELVIITDQDGLVLMAKERKANGDYRRLITEQLHAAFQENRFVTSNPVDANSRTRGVGLAQK
ncbi:MAG TPA: hypothetical protein VJ692_11965 [Nitrospiraceae bacterium]|nr:hypothetical protein [Nitrospiraceae bacterium]